MKRLSPCCDDGADADLSVYPMRWMWSTDVGSLGCDSDFCKRFRSTGGTTFPGMMLRRARGSGNHGRRIGWKKRCQRKHWLGRLNNVLLESLSQCFVSLCSSLVATLGEQIPTLLACGVPGFLPPLIANAVAQGKHRIHVFALPSHPRPFET
jgi:hypothetical protein